MAAEDEIMNDVEMDFDNDRDAEDMDKDDALDIDTLLDLLMASKKAGDIIAEKDLISLIGLSGAGKTTTALFLAGAKFEEEDVDGYAHYKPIEIPNEALSKFAASGGANSVTTTIQTTTVTLEGGNGQKELITICDTPGFGDTKGAEMEIANGLGIIHALKRSASIKPVLVLDHKSMDANRWYALRKNLSTIIAMMGHKSLDFSSFSYIFTRCEGKSKKRISKQLSGFQNTVRSDPKMKDKDILDALLTDMISKTKPDDVICIDPEEPDDAPHILRRLWSGSRLKNPAETFVNFCSNETMAALFVQVSILVSNIEMSLTALDLDSAEAYLRRMSRLAEALSLSEVNEAVEKGTTKVEQYVNQLSSGINDVVTHIGFDNFEQAVNTMSMKLRLLSNSGSIRTICKMDFDYSGFTNNITTRLVSMLKQSISDLDSVVVGSEIILQKSIVRLGFLIKSIDGIVDDNGKKIEVDYSIMIKAMNGLMNPILVGLNKSLNEKDPTSTVLNECITKLNFVLTMNDFFHSDMFTTFDLKLFQPLLFGTELKNITDNLIDRSQDCEAHLKHLDNTLQEELLGEKQWSYSSILKLNESVKYKEYRDFLQAISSSEPLVAFICNGESSPNLTSMIRDFDDAISKYLPNLVIFLQKQLQIVVSNETGEMTGRVNEAGEIMNSVDGVIVITNTLQDLDSAIIQTVLEDLNGVKIRSTHFIEELKKNPIRRHNICPGKALKPTEEELSRTNYKRALCRWYERCNELKLYWTKHGHCNIPQQDPKLGKWVRNQRVEKKKYEADATTTSMTDEKLQHLLNMDFQWNVKKERNEVFWNQKFVELKRFKDEYGHCHVPKRTPSLGTWVNNQKNRRASTSKDKLAKLETIGLFD